MHFRDSPDFLNGLRIPGNNWFRRFAVTYIYIYVCIKDSVLSFEYKKKTIETKYIKSYPK